MELVHIQAPITYVVAAFPDEVLKGTIAFLNLEVEQNTNIDLFRVEISNPANKYKPGMMVE